MKDSRPTRRSDSVSTHNSPSQGTPERLPPLVAAETEFRRHIESARPGAGLRFAALRPADFEAAGLIAGWVDFEPDSDPGVLKARLLVTVGSAATAQTSGDLIEVFWTIERGICRPDFWMEAVRVPLDLWQTIGVGPRPGFVAGARLRTELDLPRAAAPVTKPVDLRFAPPPARAPGTPSNAQSRSTNTSHPS